MSSLVDVFFSLDRSIVRYANAFIFKWLVFISLLVQWLLVDVVIENNSCYLIWFYLKFVYFNAFFLLSIGDDVTVFPLILCMLLHGYFVKNSHAYEISSKTGFKRFKKIIRMHSFKYTHFNVHLFEKSSEW